MAATDSTLTPTAWVIRQADNGTRFLVLTGTADGASWEVLVPGAEFRTV